MSKHARPIHTTPYVPLQCVRMADAQIFSVRGQGMMKLQEFVCLRIKNMGKTGVGAEAEKQYGSVRPRLLVRAMSLFTYSNMP